MKKIISLSLLLVCFLGGTAQQLLTLNEAIEIALKNNYDILLAKNTETITKVNNTMGNAGMLPNVDLNVTQNLANTNINQKFSNGLEVQQNGVGSSNLNANIALSWTLFDGMRMFAAKDRLEELEIQSGYNLKQQIQLTVAQVMVEYYGMVGQKMQIKATEKALDLLKKRFEVVKTQYEVGSVSAFELNQVSIDKNTINTSLLLLNAQLKNSKAAFNTLLSREVTMNFDVKDSIEIDTNQTQPTLASVGSIEDKNFSLLSAQSGLSIAKLQYRETKAQQLPLVQLNSNYAYNRQSSEAGFSLLNQSNGLNFGVTATMPLFRGGTIKNQIKTSNLQIRSSRLQFSRLKNNINYQYQQAFNRFEAYKAIAIQEEDNAELAQKNLKIAEGRLKQGLSTLLEVKEGDRNWLDAENRLIEARYNLKVAEIELQQLRGELVK